MLTFTFLPVHFLAVNYHLQTYIGLSLYLVIVLAICVLLVALAYFFSLSTTRDNKKLNEYECGFAPFESATRLPFDVHFYLVGVLLLIFSNLIRLFIFFNSVVV
jgi:NADH:ubiquinone oxidoreductase subunit 3 (subunit A)